MLHIDGLDLTDVVSFKEVSVDFKSTLTYIRGVNKDSDLARPTGNGTGKSLFFSAIPNVWYSAPPLALRKKSRKDMLGRKSSSIGLIFRPSDNGPEYEIIQTGSKYTIFENGNDLKITTIPRAEEFIKKLFPISEIEFYSRCYISTQRPYALLRDSDSDRLQYIVDIARLDQYSAIHRYFLNKAGTIKDNEIRLSVLEQQMASVKKKLRAAKSDVTKEEYRSLKRKYEECSAELDKHQAERFTLLAQQQALNSLLTVERELDDLRKQYKFKKGPTEQLAILRNDKKAASAWESYSEQLAQTRRIKNQLLAKISELEANMPDGPVDGLRGRAKTLNKELNSVSSEIARMEGIESQFAELTEEYEEAKVSFDELGILESKVDLERDYDEAIAEAKLRLKLQSLLDHEDAHGDTGTCPTCQADIDFNDIRRILKGERKALDIATANKRAQTLLKALKGFEKKLSKLVFDAGELKTLRTRRKRLAADIEAAEANLEQIEELASLRSRLEDVEKPAKPKSAQPSLSLEEIEAGIDLCHEIEKHLKAKTAILENHSDFEKFRSADKVEQAVQSVTSTLAAKAKIIRKVESTQAECAEKIAAYEQYVNTVKIYREEEVSTQSEIDKLKPSVSSKKLVTVLTKAYGSKGLRAYAANSFCALYEANLNHYRDLIFAEPFEFKVEASDTGVSIMVDRNNGKPDAKSDVRHLSGAEGECFALLSAAALITLTPDSHKLNMIVLDEPTSHMHAVTRELFNQKFVPFIRELVPSVFIITPHDDDCGPNSVEWVVEKSKGVSKLVQMQ